MTKIMKMASIVAIGALGLAASAQATTFSFQFDDSGGGLDGTVATPIVGRGTLTTTETLGVGVYALDTLPGLTMAFDVGGDYYTIDDVATPTDGVAIAVTAFGDQERLVFTENTDGPPADQDGGPANGSLDLVNNQIDLLTFEPTFVGGNNLYVEEGQSYNAGNYLAQTGTVPEPWSWAMMLVGFGAVGLSLRVGRRTAIARA
jgi:hypothetical protein